MTIVQPIAEICATAVTLLIEQMELQLEELEAAATEDEIAAERATARTTTVAAFERRRPIRKPFPEHLPRERVVVKAPTSCTCCGSARIVKMGEDITETLEVIPRRWKVIQTVREKFTCRDCERISQPPAPFHPTPRGWAGPNLLATILFEKFGQHQPLNRQAERYAKEGVEISLSTLADQVGACAVALQPIHDLIRAHVLGAERLHADDTTVPLLAKGGTQTARLWTYARDERPWGGTAAPAAWYRFSGDRKGQHPKDHLARFRGWMHADGYAGFEDLYRSGTIREVACMAHVRRKFVDIHRSQASPIAEEAIGRIAQARHRQRAAVDVEPRGLVLQHALDVVLERLLSGVF